MINALEESKTPKEKTIYLSLYSVLLIDFESSLTSSLDSHLSSYFSYEIAASSQYSSSTTTNLPTFYNNHSSFLRANEFSCLSSTNAKIIFYQELLFYQYESHISVIFPKYGLKPKHSKHRKLFFLCSLSISIFLYN